MRLGFIFLLSLQFSFLACAKVEVFETSGQRYLEYEQWTQELPDHGFILLGEYHYQKSIQKLEGQLIRDIVKQKQRQAEVSVAWEFLEHPRQQEIDKLKAKWLAGALTTRQLLVELLNDQHTSYLPLLQAVRQTQAKLKGVNVSRVVKRVLIKDGLPSINADLIPPDHYVGGELYRRRFKEATGGHVGSDQFEGYFLAQCFTDSVMAHELTVKEVSPLNILVAGSFHTDYGQGTTERLKKRTAEPVVSLKLVDKNQLTPKELEELLKPHPDYGVIADYILLVD